MKTKTHFIAALMLALFALTACSGKKTTAAQKMDTDENPDSLIEAAENNSAAEAHQPTADAEDDDGRDSETAPIFAACAAYEKSKALIQAALDNDTADVQRLIAAGANVNARDSRGTALGHAAVENSVDMARFLIEAGADVNAKNDDGETALMNALWVHRHQKSSEMEIVKPLLEAGADVNAKCNDGTTALIYAARRSSVDVAELLIEAGADVNARDNRDRTALIWAALTPYRDAVGIAELLIDAGADVNAKDNEGKTALMWAVDNGATNVAELLKAAGAQ